MLKRMLALGLAAVLFLGFNTVFAEMDDADYHDKIVKLHAQVKDAYHDYVEAKSQARKDALDKLEKLGRTAKDAEARKAIFENRKTKMSELEKAYKTKKEAILEKEKKLKAARKEALQAIKAAAKEAKKTTKKTNY